MRRIVPFAVAMSFYAFVPAAAAPPEPSLVSFAAGALIVEKPRQRDENWSSFWMLDERADSGWASPEGVLIPAVTVIALPERTLLKRLELDTGDIDGENRGAKDVLVEVSDTSDESGFQPIAEVSLADKADGQSFPVAAEVPGHWVRLTVKNNHGAKDFMELMDFRAYGTQLTHTPFADVSGTYSTGYGDFHIRQERTSVTGCYEVSQGLLDGTIEGRTLKFTWRQGGRPAGEAQGSAIMVFSPDGQHMLGLWWYQGAKDRGGRWNGAKKSDDVGSCPHWGGAKEQKAKLLAPRGPASSAPPSG